MPSSQEIARVMAEMDRFNQPSKVTLTEERYEKRVASVGGSYGGLTALLQQGAPGNWASDHKSEAEKFAGWHYVAISSIGKAVRSANCEAYQEKIREYAKAYNEQDDDSEPLPKWHPLVKLLKRPNPSQSGASFREEVAIQLCLTGSALIWNVPNQMGRTVERYVIPTAIAEPRQPERGRPKGGWYINPEVARWQIESGWFLYTGLATAIGKVIDARDVQVIRFIHPVFKDEGQSPVSAGALWTDTSEKVDISRHSHLRNGSDPSVIIGIDGVEDEGTLQRMSAKFNEKYAGPSKHGKAMFVNGQNVKIEPVTRTPAEMAYEGAFVQFRDAIMALHGVTPIAAGIEAPSGDDGLYAPLKQFISGTVQPILDLMAEEDTEQLAGQFGEGISVLYTAKAVDDAKLTEQQINTDIAAGAIEVDEIRKLRGRKPWGGEKGKAVAGQGAKEEPKPGLPGLAQGVPGLETKPNGLEPQTGSQALDPSKPPQGTPDPMKLAEEAVAKALGGFADRLSALLKSGNNCGTGAGGFQPGNDCAGGGEGGDKPAKKKRGKKVAEESSGPKIEVFERGMGEREFTSRGELIRGRIGDLPITEGEPGLIEKLSKKTKAGVEAAMADPDLIEDLKAGGVESLNIEPTNYYKKRTGRSGNWYGGYADGALTIHPKTVDHIESSAVEERVGGGLRRLISHEAGHGVWDRARDADKKAFAEAVKKNPEIVAYVSSVTNVAANPNAFNDTGSRVVTESFAEIHALRRYNREMYDSLPEDIRNPVESARKFGLELSERMAGFGDRLKPKWQKSSSDCGANAEGGGGFQPGNTCGRGDGSGESDGEGKASKKKVKDEALPNLTLTTEQRQELVDQGLVLHGTSGDFAEFKQGGHKAIYFSDPSENVTRKTQAEHIAGGPFGGYLLAVRLEGDNFKEFNPYSDPQAFEILKKVTGKDSKRIDYTDMPEIVEAAEKYGYNKYRVYEPAIQGYSIAITDPSAAKIVKRWRKAEKSYATNERREVQRDTLQTSSGATVAVTVAELPGIVSKGDNCGANAQGGGGFQPGNTCGKRGGKGSESAEGGGKGASVNPKILAWAREKFGDDTTAENFAKWFGDSKVVDADGNPLVVYHGTSESFDQFDTSISLTDGRDRAAFFSDTPEVAATYADHQVLSEKQRISETERALADLEREYDRLLGEFPPERENAFIHYTNQAVDSGQITREEYQNLHALWDRHQELDSYTLDEIQDYEAQKKPQMKAVYLSLKNPKIIDANGMGSSYIVPNALQDVDRKKHDGIIFRNIVDTGDGTDTESTVFAVFNSTGIKSATGNSGTFDPKDPNITKSAASDSYNPPESARNNARKVLRWKEQHGDAVRGMTATGWARANQLASGEKLSRETVGRMAAFARHRKNSKVDPKFRDEPWRDAGYVAWLGWGGDSGINWAAGVIAGEGKSGSGCGANAEGGGGFQPGNTCGKEDGAGQSDAEWEAGKKQRDRERKQRDKERREWFQLAAEMKVTLGLSEQEVYDQASDYGDEKANQIKWMRSELDKARSGEFAEARKKARPALDKLRAKVIETWEKESIKIEQVKSKESDLRKDRAQKNDEHSRLMVEEYQIKKKFEAGEATQAQLDEAIKKTNDAKQVAKKATAAWSAQAQKRIDAEEKLRAKVFSILGKDGTELNKSLGESAGRDSNRKAELTKNVITDELVVRSDDARAFGKVTKEERNGAQSLLISSVNSKFHYEALASNVEYQEGARAHAYPALVRGKYDAALSRGLSEAEARAEATITDKSVFDFDSSKSTYLHEYGHQIEFGNTEAARLASDFLSARIKDDEVVSFREKFGDFYKEDERGADDNFGIAMDALGYGENSNTRAHYAGKIYKNGSTEVISMGMELLHRNPYEFATNDPEWFDLVSGVVTGRLLVKSQAKARSEN